ncbi:MAG: cytochrome c oxidase subunit II [Verrucomicrobiota bacterium]
MLTKLLGLPPLASEHGADVDKLILYVHWLMAALFVGWLAYFFYVIFRFRRSNHPKADYGGVKSHASSYIEFAVAAVEGVLLLGFAIPLWSKAVDQFPSEKDATVIRVMAQQFLWNARYPGPDGVFGKADLKFVSSTNAWGIDPSDPNGKDDFSPASINEITVPVNKPVIAHITSQDVVHSFKINPLRVTQDAIPGLSIPTWFRPTHEGKYLINCAQLCGNGHSAMKGYLNVVSQQQYDQWVAERTAAPPAPAASFE